MAIGIYKITNVVNSKFYIGSTRRLNERKAEHKYKLKIYKGNSIIRNAVLKYGEENFNFEVLEKFTFGNFATPKYIDELITSREQYYVDILNPNYNIRKVDVSKGRGDAPYCENSSENLLSKREIYRRTLHDNKIKVDVYKRETLDFVETISGIRNCAKVYNIDCSQLTQLCKKGYTKQYLREYLFCYKGDNINKLLYEHSKFTFQRKDTTAILQVDKNGNFIKEWRTGSDAEKYLKLSKGSISRVISGKYSHTKNCYFISKN